MVVVVVVVVVVVGVVVGVIVGIAAEAEDVYKASLRKPEANVRRAVWVDACGRPGGPNHQKRAV